MKRKGKITKQTEQLLPILSGNVKDAEAASHRLLLKAGLVRQVAAGIYTFLPVGYKVLENIQSIIVDEMEEIDARRVMMPSLHPAELWKQTNRWEEYGPELLRLKDRKEHRFALGATHEEVVTNLFKNEVSSYKNLPLSVFQIQTKYRDEARPRFGLIRCREFLMKDAYSFHTTKESLDETYDKFYQAYHNIFQRVGIDFKAVSASGGLIGGSGGTHEFIALADIGEDEIVICKSCGFASNVEKNEEEGKSSSSCLACGSAEIDIQKGIEIGHIFKNGTKYSDAFNATVATKEGNLQKMLMGCYGIGISRLVAAFIEQNHDENGIIWSKSITPYHVHIVKIDDRDEDISEEIESDILEIAEDLQFLGYDVFVDDRDKKPKVKFEEADLLGIPLRIDIGKKGIEIKNRRTGEKQTVSLEEVVQVVENFYSQE